MAGSAHTLNLPRPVWVRASVSGIPQQVERTAVEQVRESWLVEDRWWTDHPLRRRYWEVIGEDGRNLVVFHDLQAEGWFAQRDLGRPPESDAQRDRRRRDNGA
jgi:hypothetical protein